ncbi:MAG: glutathione S-transferase family protein [Pseudomonadota bacterium]
MTEFILYHMPRACGFVTMNALEEAGLTYELRPVNIMLKEQKAPDYMKMHPEGKVPLLLGDGVPLTENAAILIYLDAIAPHAKLLTSDGSPFGNAKAYSDLIWCSATFHPAARMLRMPKHFTDDDQAPVQAKGRAVIEEILSRNEARLSSQDWWSGSEWSIVDVYTFWCTATAASNGLVPMQNYPAVQAHMKRVGDRPSFKAAFARQEDLQKEAGIVLPA